TTRLDEADPDAARRQTWEAPIALADLPRKRQMTAEVARSQRDEAAEQAPDLARGVFAFAPLHPRAGEGESSHRVPGGVNGCDPPLLRPLDRVPFRQAGGGGQRNRHQTETDQPLTGF